jgi:hypothetical protein
MIKLWFWERPCFTFCYRWPMTVLPLCAIVLVGEMSVAALMPEGIFMVLGAELTWPWGLDLS